jgi:5-methylcytosine-specific restriction endonuclease McrA
MRICESEFADDFVAAVDHLLRGDRPSASDFIKRIPGSITIFEDKARSPATITQLNVFKRDGFQCRYCSRRTIFLPVLRALHRLFPLELPWHPHSKLTECHLSFWRDFASCDHLVPVARGGSSCEENLVTSCYMCNSIKQNWLLEELRWDLLPSSSGNWDGLTSAYPKLVTLIGDADTIYHRRWCLALNTLQKTTMVATGVEA